MSHTKWDKRIMLAGYIGVPHERVLYFLEREIEEMRKIFHRADLETRERFNPKSLFKHDDITS